MRVQRKLKPGQPGTKKLLTRYVSWLIYPRCRDDKQHHKDDQIIDIIEEALIEIHDRGGSGGNPSQLDQARLRP